MNPPPLPGKNDDLPPHYHSSGVSSMRPGRSTGFYLLVIGIPVLSLLLIGVCIFGCLGLMISNSKSLPAGVEDVPANTEMRYGDLGVYIFASVDIFRGTSPGGTQIDSSAPQFVVTVRFINHNKTKEIVVPSQVEVATLTDDLGNRLDTFGLTTEAGFQCTLNGQIPAGKAIRVRSDVYATDLFVFRRPLEGVKTLTLTMDGRKYGGSKTIRVIFTREGAKWK